jgi:hypothetical protein
MGFSTRQTWQGIGAGFIAGLVFAIAAITTAMIGGGDGLEAFRSFASLWFGALAFEVDGRDAPRAADLVLIGLFVHMSIAVLAGILYALVDTAIAERRVVGARDHALIGMAYGGLLWLVDFQLMGRLVYPWFLELNQPLFLALHVLAYGLPLGVVYAMFESRARAPVPTRGLA